MTNAPPLAHAGALATSSAPAAAADVARVLNEFWQLDGTLTAVAGERDTNFRLDSASGRFLVKVTHPQESPAAVDAQVAVLAHLARVDPTLPLQHPVRATHGALLVPYPPDPRRVVRVVGYLDGQLRRDCPWHDGLAGQIGAIAGRLDVALAGFAHPGCDQMLLWDLRRSAELMALAPFLAGDPIEKAVEETLVRFVDSLPVLTACPVQPIHNDLNPSNLLLDHDATRLCGVIDFGDMILAPVVIELAVACAYLTDAPDLVGAIGDCVEAYLAKRPLDADLVARLPTWIATRWAMTILITEWRAQLQPENAAYILRNNPGSRRGLTLLDDAGRARLSARLQELTA